MKTKDVLKAFNKLLKNGAEVHGATVAVNTSAFTSFTFQVFDVKQLDKQVEGK